jgi:phosphatidate cytidylyltransferase
MGGLEKKKICTGASIVPPLILLIVWGPPFTLSLMVLAATFLGLREFYNLALPSSKRTERFVGIGLGLILAALLAWGDSRSIPLLLVLILLILSVLFMGTSQDLASTIPSIGISLFGILYIGFLLSHVSLIRNLQNGKAWALFLILTVWAGDIFAFSGGSLFGKHKLYPKISPKKSYEGLIAGIIGSILVALAFSFLFLPHLGSGTCVLLAIGIEILGQIGDFTESMLKRSARVKDSGDLIPGHGGMLDRLDSFLFSSPFLYYSLLYLIREAS